MYPKMKKYNRGKFVPASEYNKLVDAVNKLLGLEVGKKLKLQRRAGGFFIDGKTDVLVYWAKVIRGLKHADVDAAKQKDGITKYVIRVLDSGAESYSGGAEYSKGEKVLYSTGDMDVEFLYKAAQTTTGNDPPTTTVGSGDTEVFYPDSDANWNAVDIIPKGIAATTNNYTLNVRTEDTELRQFVRWFEIDDIVPLIKYDDDWYIFQTVIPVGAIGSASIAWNEDDNRMMAVYK